MSHNYLLTQEDAFELVKSNQYKVEQSRKYHSRCISGQYKNAPNLPGLTIPGGDAGELALLYATANSYGFEVDYQQAFQILIELIGGSRFFSIDLDSVRSSSQRADGCIFRNAWIISPPTYSLEPNQITILQEQTATAKKNGAQELVLDDEHREGAIIILHGEYSVYPQYIFRFEDRSIDTQIYLYQQTLADRRRKELARLWFTKRAVSLYPRLDEEYLYEALSEMAENQLFAGLKTEAQGLPIYKVTIDKDNYIDISRYDEI